MQAKINLQSFKSTLDSLKQHLKAFDRKRSLGAPEILHPRARNSVDIMQITERNEEGRRSPLAA